MALPEIPESYFKLINLLWMIALSILGVLGYQKINNVQTGQDIIHQKQDENIAKVDATEAKVDKAAVVAVEVERKLTAQNAAVAKTAEKVEEVRNAVKKMDR